MYLIVLFGIILNQVCPEMRHVCRYCDGATKFSVRSGRPKITILGEELAHRRLLTTQTQSIAPHGSSCIERASNPAPNLLKTELVFRRGRRLSKSAIPWWTQM